MLNFEAMDKAKQIHQDRHEQYGDFVKTMGEVAQMWAAMLSASNQYKVVVSTEVACYMMAAFKLHRACLPHELYNDDHVVDGFNYITAGDNYQRENQKERTEKR